MVMRTELADVDSILMECVERGLEHFGPSFKYVIYKELKTKDNIEGMMLIRKPLTFSDGLDRMFGGGSVSIRKAIILEIGKEFGLSTEQEGLVSIIKTVRETRADLRFA